MTSFSITTLSIFYVTLSVITLSVEVPLLEGLDHLWNQRELVKYFIFLGIASSMATVMGPQSHLEQLHCPRQELQLGVNLIKLFLQFMVLI